MSCGFDLNLYMLVGIPGCGKSTVAKTLFPTTRIVSSDAIRTKLFGEDQRVAHDRETKARNNDRVFALYHGEIGAALDYGHSVVADATNVEVRSRAQLQSIAERRNAKVHVILFKNLQEAVERNAARGDFNRVPEDAMDRMISKYWDTLSRIPHENYASIITIGSVS